MHSFKAQELMDTSAISNDKVVLRQLTEKDAAAFYEIYVARAVRAEDTAFFPGETPEQFTNRIISICDFIWTIRTAGNPELVIGDCAIHHFNKDEKEVEIGGSLFPEYRGKGLMRSAFELVIEVAKEKLKVTAILGRTTTNNFAAIRLVEKMGFEKVSVSGSETLLKKKITAEGCGI